MSVDKFGRYSSGGEALRGAKGEGFNLTAEGNYDIKGKLLSNVGKAVSDGDVVNLKTVKDTCLTMTKGHYDGGMKRLTRIGDPKDNTDAINRAFFYSYSPMRLEKLKSFSFRQHRAQDIAAPQDEGDAVNLLYLKKNTLTRDGDVFNAASTVITNVGSPKTNTDAVNMDHLNKEISKVTSTVGTSLIQLNSEFNDVKQKMISCESGIANTRQELDNFKRDTKKYFTKFNTYISKHIPPLQGRAASELDQIFDDSN